MREGHVPPLVERDIAEAVRSAIQFGCSAKEFRRLAAEAWDEELRLKRERDVEKLLA